MANQVGNLTVTMVSQGGSVAGGRRRSPLGSGKREATKGVKGAANELSGFQLEEKSIFFKSIFS